MKWLIASDIHGSAYYCEKLIHAFEYEKADKLLLLGDVLYHGPRNDLPKEYNPKKVIELLNGLSQKVLCVRGNCDSEVDQMVLNFPLMAEYIALDLGNSTIFATHGHIFSEQKMLPCAQNSILLCGHTHIPACTKHENFTYLNPGSISLPKENSPHSYMTLCENTFIWKKLDDNSEFGSPYKIIQ